MKFDFFYHVNNLNGKDGVYYWNRVRVTELNETKGTITFRKINGTETDDEEFTMNGNVFMEQLMKHHMFYVINPEVLNNSSFVNYYIVDRTLNLRRQEEENHVYAEKYAANNTERIFKYKLVIDYREPTTTRHKYVFNLGDFLGHYIDHDNDIGKTFAYIMKKITKKIKTVPELCCLTPKEQMWIEKTVGKELDYIVYSVLR